MTRNERFLFLQSAVGAFSEELLSPTVIVPVLILRLGFGPSAVGILNGLLATAWMMQVIGAWQFAGVSRKTNTLFRLSAISFACPLIVAVSLLWIAPTSASAAAIILAGAVITKAVMGALGNTLGLELACTAVEDSARLRFFATRSAIGDTAALLASMAVAFILGSLVFPSSYAVAAALSAVAAGIVCLAFLGINEAPATPVQRQPFSVFIKSSVDMLRPGAGGLRGQQFRRYVGFRQVMNLSRCAYPFAVIYALDRCDASESFIGAFLFAMIIGKITTALCLRNYPHAAPSAVMQLGLCFTVLSMLSILLIPHISGGLLSFFFQGAFLACMFTADPVLMLALSPTSSRMQGVSLAMVVCHPGNIAWGVLSGFLVQHYGFDALAAIAVALALLAIAILRINFQPEPAIT